MKNPSVFVLAFLVSAIGADAFAVTRDVSSLESFRSSHIPTSRYSSINGNNGGGGSGNDDIFILSKARQIIEGGLLKNDSEQARDRDSRHFLETTRFISTPFLTSLASFYLYPTTSRLFHSSAQFLSNNNWVPVDGGQLQWSILLPALNGVVMTAISLLYANLISTTGTQLRNRQIKIQESLSTEVDGIRGLAQLLQYYPESVRAQFGAHLMVYIQMLVIELGPESDSLTLRSTIPPLSDYRDELHGISIQNEIHGNILERSYEMLDRVSSGRSARITSLQTTFPPLHYVTISALTAAILFVFLIETDRPVILFLDNFQLRLVWAILVGTLTAIFCIGIDLSYPFVGTYVVPADQLLNESDELLGLIRDTTSKSKSSPSKSEAAGGQREVPPVAESNQEEVRWQIEGEADPGCSNEAEPMTVVSDATRMAADENKEDVMSPSEDAPPQSFEEYMKRRSMGEYRQ